MNLRTARLGLFRFLSVAFAFVFAFAFWVLLLAQQQPPTNVNVNAKPAQPTITNLNPTSGSAGASVTITGTGFAATQGSGTVTFNGVTATVTSWSSLSIVVTVPSTTTGNVVVTQNGLTSNGINFTIGASLTCAISAGGGTVRTVKTSGGDFTTPTACANASAAGDICEVYSGTFVGGTITASGSSLSAPITIRAATGQTPVLSSKLTVTDRSYLLITGLTFTNTAAILAQDDQGAGHTVATSYVDICNNTITKGALQGGGGVNGIISLYGDHVAIEYNEITGNTAGTLDADFVEGAGADFVMRGNYMHDMDAGGSTTEHVDGLQIVGGGTTPSMVRGLFENNVEKNCLNNAGNCHFVINRASGIQVNVGLIIRYSYDYNLDGSGPINCGGGSTDTVSHCNVYNLTTAAEHLYNGNGCSVAWFAASPNHGVAFNNISYNDCTTGAGWDPWGTPGDARGGNLVRVCTPVSSPGSCTPYTGSAWATAYKAESTYATLGNADPAFANYPTNVSVANTSAVINAAVSLDTVASGDSGSGTSLVVNDAYRFHAGWGNIQGDTIKIGTNSPVQISSINYSTNTLTLASAVTRSSGDAIRLYALSDGTRVLYSTNGDVGACPYGVTTLKGCQ